MNTHSTQPIQTPEVAPATVVPTAGQNTTAGAPRVQALTTPTQIRRPGRAVIRTAIQTAIPVVLALGVVVPEIVRIILEEAGETMPDNLRAVLLGISAAVVAVAAIIARVMALPAVEAFLRSTRILSGAAAAPAAFRDRDEAGRVALDVTGRVMVSGIILGLFVIAMAAASAVADHL